MDIRKVGNLNPTHSELGLGCYFINSNRLMFCEIIWFDPPELRSG